MRCTKIITILWMAVFSSVLYGDEIIFKNDNRLTGQIQQLTDGKLIFNSDVAGQITINITDVQTFSTDASIKIHLKDGTVLNQKISATKQNRFAIEASDTLQAQEFDLAAIDSINPPEKPKPKWTGSISAGFTATQGNTITDSQNISVSLQRRSEKDRIKLGADFLKGQQENVTTGAKTTIADWWRAIAKYDYFFTKKLYGYLDGRYERDRVAQLERRVLMGGGGGYQWLESDDMNFSTEFGIASLYEKFFNRAMSNEELSAQLGYHFDKKLRKTVKFIHDLTYYPSTDNFYDYFLSTTAEIRANFTERMFTNFKIILDHDATPAPGAKTTDVKYILGVGLSF